MSVDGRKREELMRATAEAAETARRELAAGAGGHRPGDLVLLPATAEQAVEWLLAERDGDRWLLVPADVDPWVGSADVEVTADETGGPLVLRCRHALWADAAVLADAMDSGRVDPGRAAEAAACHRQASADDSDGSPLQRETDDDPVYRRRDAEVATARAVIAGAALKAEHERQRGRFGGGFGTVGGWRAAAAVLLVALVGVGWWAFDLRGMADGLRGELTGTRGKVTELRREIERLDGPRAVLRSGELFQMLGDPTRTPEAVAAVPSGDHLVFRLTVAEELPAHDHRVHVARADGEVLASFELPFDLGVEYLVELPADRFPAGTYDVLLLDPASDPARQLDHRELVIPATD